MTTEDIITRGNRLKTWYWENGHTRQGLWSLDRGGWLDSLHRVTAEAEAIKKAAEGRKPAVAVWGPSASGKSTFLNTYLKGEADESGNGSAIQWDKNFPVLFAGDGGSVTVLNPFTMGKDASGCVSRFTMTESVAFPEYPVTLELASEAQLMHALAVGYLTETTAKHPEKEHVVFRPDDIRDLASRGGAITTLSSPEAFGILLCTANILELFFLSDEARYVNLKQEWPSLRKCILESKSLCASSDAAYQFAAELFWDGWSSLTKTFRSLLSARKSWIGVLGGRPLHVSYEVASYVLNISSAEAAGVSKRLQELLPAWGITERDGAMLLGSSGGEKCFPSLVEFAIFQGIVWEMVLPVRSDVIKKCSPIAWDLLKAADLIDFPGVATEWAAGQDQRLDNLALAGNELAALTRVLKRGKTGSIVTSSSANLAIDAFAILVRANVFPQNPTQILGGIKSWMKAMGVPTPPSGRDLPLNLVLTYAAKLVNDLATNSTADLDFGPSLRRALDFIADPKRAATFVVNYPEWPDGKIHPSPDVLSALVTRIESDPLMQQQFREHIVGFRKICTCEDGEEDGGRAHLISNLTDQVRQSRKPHLLYERERRIQNDWNALVDQVLPPEDADETARAKAFGNLHDQIVKELKQDPEDEIPVLEIAKDILGLIQVNASTISPLQAANLGTVPQAKSYLDSQIASWMEDRRQSFHPHRILTGDPERRQMILYFSQQINAREIGRWMSTEINQPANPRESLELTRYISVLLSNYLLHGNLHGPVTSHRSLHGNSSVESLLEKFVQFEMDGMAEYQSMPHYVSIIKPFLDRLAYLKGHAGGGNTPRPPEDTVLSNILVG
jgi:hypothetical protein